MTPDDSGQATVGIITRTKSRCVLLRRALKSITHQTYPNWTLVIVNDGGDPAEVDGLLQHYAGVADGRIRVIHNPKSLGMEGASKIGLEAAGADLLIFHDDDDSWAPEFLSITVHQLLRLQKQFPSIQGVTTYSHLVRETVRGNLVEIDSVEPFNAWVPSGFLSLDRMLAGNFIPPISFLFSRKAYEETGSIYEIIPYLGDWDFLIRFLSRFDIYMVPQFLAFYHWRYGTEPGGVNNSVTAELDRHRDYRQYLLNRWLREDFATGKVGVGTYANLRVHLETLVRQTKAPPAPPPLPPLPPDREIVPRDLAREVVDYYWESPSWKALRPFRSLLNFLLRIPPEKRPAAAGVQEAWQIARAVQESVSWNAMAPLRLLQGLWGAFRRAIRWRT